ncbi:uncharacterized mitochondrial protein-like protein [Tanacetum coccineum]
MFDEYFTPPSITVSLVQEADTPRAVVLADSPVSTSIDQYAPSSSAVDLTLFTRQAGDDLLLVQIYVDDIIFASTNIAICNEFANQMTTKFKMSMMGQIDFVDTPTIEKSKLGEDLQGTQIDATLYRGMIGSLMYLTSSRLDLIYVVILNARYQDTDMSMTAYADADHAGCQDTRRSTSGNA